MAELTIKRYSPEYFDKWNKFVESSNNGTLFHRLDFLAYHDIKFKENEHHLIWFKGEAIFAVMPMALFESNGEKIAKSPYGSSFGGIVYHKIKLNYSIEMIELLTGYLKSENIIKLYLALAPDVYSKDINNYLEYSLSYHNCKLYSRDVFSIIELPDNHDSAWRNYEGRARTTIKKISDNFEIFQNVEVEDFYPILIEDKARHGNTKPTHSFSELKWLKQKFPDKIIFDIAVHLTNGGKAGVCYIKCNNNATLTFYMAQDDIVKGLNGKNLLVNAGIKKAINEKVKYFDFGGSTIGYTIQNIGVANFKESFGAKGYLRETYCWENK